MLTFSEYIKAINNQQTEAKKGAKVLPAGTKGKKDWLDDLATKFNKDVYHNDYKNVAYGMPTDKWGCMYSFNEYREKRDEELLLEGKKKKKKNWIAQAINPDHKGFCSPITKKTCTPRRKALALRFKKGGDLYAGKKDDKK